MTISAATPWRDIGPVDLRTWQRVIDSAGGPEGLIREEAWAAAGRHSALALAMLRMESSFGTHFDANPAANRNPWNLKLPQGGGYVKFATWAEGAEGWHDRLTSDTYKSGVYSNTRTIGDLIHVYAPTSENATEHYIRVVVGLLNGWLPGWQPEGEPMADITFGNVEHPPFIDRTIPDVQNRAWDNLGPRLHVGVCQHSMIGTLWGTDGWFRRPGGQALTDYGIGGSTDGAANDGLILRWNDPRGRAGTAPVYDKTNHLTAAQRKVSANRAGWANGGSNGLEGDGPAYVRRMGVNSINRDLVSIERSDGGQQMTAMSPKQLASICALTAHWFDVAKVPWDRFPLNPAYGIVTHMLHLEFATKSCPFAPVTSRIDEIQNRVRAILKAGQTATTGDDQPVPPPGPVTPDKDWPNGWTTAQLTDRFGTVMLRHPDGKETPQGFDEKGPISNGWVAKAAELGITKVADIPRPLAWSRMIDADDLQVDMLVFDGKGSDNWALYRPAAEVAWRWIR